MEEELALLRERVARLERRADWQLEIHDVTTDRVNSAQEVVDGFIVPLLLHLGTDAYRDRLLRWLARLEQSAIRNVEEDGGDPRDLARLRYWHDLVRKREPFPDFPPDGWMSPREE